MATTADRGADRSAPPERVPRTASRALTMGRVDPRVLVHLTTKSELLYVLLCALLGGFKRELADGRARVARVMSRLTSRESARRAHQALLEGGWISEDEEGVVRLHDDGALVEGDTGWWADRFWGERPALFFKAQWALEAAHTLTAMELRLALLLLFVGDKTNTSWHGTMLLASHLRTSPKSITRARAGLAAKGLVVQRGARVTVARYAERLDVAAYERALVAREAASDVAPAPAPAPIPLSEELRRFVVADQAAAPQNCPAQTTKLSRPDHKAVPGIFYKNQDSKPGPQHQAYSSRACAHAHAQPRARVTREETQASGGGSQPGSSPNAKPPARRRREAAARGVEALVIKGLRLIAKANDVGVALVPYVRRALERIKPGEILTRAQLYYARAAQKLPLHRWLSKPIETWRLFGDDAAALRREAQRRALEWLSRQINPSAEPPPDPHTPDPDTPPASPRSEAAPPAPRPGPPERAQPKSEKREPTEHTPPEGALSEADAPELTEETLVRVVWYPHTAAQEQTFQELTRRTGGRLGWVVHLCESDWPTLTLEQKLLVWGALPAHVQRHYKHELLAAER